MARHARAAPESRAPSETVTLHVDSLAAGGDGVARLDGMAVFVPRTAPGDVVRVQLTRRNRFGRGRVLAVVEPSRDRVVAPCAHYDRDGCGGCQWQHLALPAQRAAKAQLVVDAFRRIAQRDVPRPIVSGTDEAFGYRRTISVTVRGLGRRRVGGFRAVASPDTVVPIAHCMLAHPDVQRAWDAVRRELSRLPVGDGAAELRVTIRHFGDRDIALVVEGGAAWPAPELEALAAATPNCRGIWWQPSERPMRLIWERARGSTREPNDELTVSASFVQVNAAVAAMLQAFVLSAVQAESPVQVVDAYAGAGDLSLALASRGVRVTAIERDERAAARAATRLPSGSHVLCGRVEDLLSEALPADVLVMNPPRGGVDERVCALLAASAADGTAPRLLVYVSCDPATLARDVSRLTGWRVDGTACFDMFPQTAHVESVCLLRPEVA